LTEKGAKSSRSPQGNRFKIRQEKSGITVRIYRQRRFLAHIEQETAYYIIISLLPVASLILNASLQYWSVENSLHWTMDVTFHEDDPHVRNDNAAQNMTLLRRLALNVINQDPSEDSLRHKHHRAALDNPFLLQLFTRF
jgi:predicted transposase YbfD/YdcC